MYNILQSDVTAYVISLVPAIGDKFTIPLETLLEKTNITITQSDKFNVYYTQAIKFDETIDENSEKDAVYKKSKYLRYDPDNFILLYEIPTSFDVDMEKLPYVYDGENHVFFVNLPYKDDIEFALFPEQQSSVLYNEILSKAEEGSSDLKRYWYPIAPLSDLFIHEMNRKNHTNYRSLNLKSNDITIVGPYQLNPVNNNKSDKIKFALRNKQELPKWANALYGNEIAITNSSLVYTLDIKAKRIILPAKNTLSPEELSSSKTNLNDNPVELQASFKDGLNDIKDKILSEEKSLTERLKHADSLMTIIYLFILTIIPRILVFSLFAVQVLSLTAKYKFVQWFCKKIVDPFYILSLGRINCMQIRPFRIWVCCSFGIVIITLISREYGTQILLKLLTSLFEELILNGIKCF